jgi:hypothetical protein
LQAASPLEPDINRRVIAQILAVVNRRSLDLANGCVDFADRFPFLFPQFSVVRALQMGSGVPQIGKGVQVSGMPHLSETAQGGQGEESYYGCR